MCMCVCGELGVLLDGVLQLVSGEWLLDDGSIGGCVADASRVVVVVDMILKVSL